MVCHDTSQFGRCGWPDLGHEQPCCLAVGMRPFPRTMVKRGPHQQLPEHSCPGRTVQPVSATHAVAPG